MQGLEDKTEGTVRPQMGKTKSKIKQTWTNRTQTSLQASNKESHVGQKLFPLSCLRQYNQLRELKHPTSLWLFQDCVEVTELR